MTSFTSLIFQYILKIYLHDINLKQKINKINFPMLKRNNHKIFMILFN